MNFLDNLNFKRKLQLVLVVPVFALIVYTMLHLYHQSILYTNANILQNLTLFSKKVSHFIHETQKERGISSGYLGSKGKKFTLKLTNQRKLTNQKSDELIKFIDTLSTDNLPLEFKDNISATVQNIKEIENIRDKVDKLKISLDDVILFYSSLNDKLLKNVVLTSKFSKNNKIQSDITSYVNFLEAKEQTGIERAVGFAAFAKGFDSTGKVKSEILKFVSNQKIFLSMFKLYSNPKVKDFFENSSKDSSFKEVEHMENILLWTSINEEYHIDSEVWFREITKKINQYKIIDDFQLSNIMIKTKDELYYTQLKFIGSIIFSIGLFLLISVLISKMTTRLNSRVRDFQEGLSFFTDYVAREKEYLKPLDIRGSDEFGQMAALINIHIDRITKVIEQDKKVVKEIDDVMQRVSNGFFGLTIKQSASTQELEQLRVNINQMIVGAKEKFDLILSVLNKFGQKQFDYRLDESQLKDMNGDFGSLVGATKLLGDNISELFALIHNAGIKLNNNTNSLASAASSLKSASSTQVVELQNTNIALENINNTTDKTIQSVDMINEISQDLILTSTDGLGLAQETVDSTNEISNKIDAINDAVGIIEQISFQTNILSLNAAVEAATAGEFGKGFAVVAGEVRNLAGKSAEAAHEIKELVMSAKVKADEGIQIVENMTNGYNNLAKKVHTTQEAVEQVTMMSKQQSQGIVNIDNSIESLDEISKSSSQTSQDIDLLSSDISTLSQKLFHMTSSAKFSNSSKKQMCDMQLSDEISALKYYHLMFKGMIMSKLDDNQSFIVPSPRDCDLGIWMSKQASQRPEIMKLKAWIDLNIKHDKSHDLAQEYIDRSVQKAPVKELNILANNIEIITMDVFNAFDKLKQEYCELLVEEVS